MMMIERTGRYIGIGVASVLNLLNIERVVLGGGVMDAGELILNLSFTKLVDERFNPALKPHK